MKLVKLWVLRNAKTLKSPAAADEGIMFNPSQTQVHVTIFNIESPIGALPHHQDLVSFPSIKKKKSYFVVVLR
jgi:hypothetical protein